MTYEKLNWQDGKQPALNAANLNHMEDGIVNDDAAASNAQEAAQEAVVAANSMKIKTSIAAYVDKTYTAGEGFEVNANLEGAIGYAITISGGAEQLTVGGFVVSEAAGAPLFGMTGNSTPYSSDHMIAYAECSVYGSGLSVPNIKKFVNGNWVDCSGTFKVRIVRYDQ